MSHYTGPINAPFGELIQMQLSIIQKYQTVSTVAHS